MHIVIDAASFARALDSPIGEPAKTLLRLRRDQLLEGVTRQDIGDLAQFIVVEPADGIPAIEVTAGYPVITEAAFEWVADHGGLFEAITILSDNGFAVVLLCPDDPAVDADLLALLRDHATPADRDVVRPADQARTAAA